MHANARLTLWGRHELVRRIASGRPVAHVAAEMGISRPTAYKWWRRWQAEGDLGLFDRSSRPHSSPNQTPRYVEQRIERLRRRLKLGPARIGFRIGMSSSTVHRVLVRRGLNRLRWLDRPSGRVIRRYERPTPGDLIHVDIKKLGRIPDGGGWRMLGRDVAPDHHRNMVGYGFIHSAVDDHSRLAYSEVLRSERKDTCAEFWQRAAGFFASHGIEVRQVMTDNGPGYRSHAFAAALGDVEHLFIRPRRPETNGKVERFNRTLLEEWAYVRLYRSEAERVAALEPWLHLYNHHRSHYSLAGNPPIARVNNLAAQYN